jgi:hypothetical protein
VEFYVGTIYPGVLSEDGSSLPEGVPLAIPFAEDTNPALKSAIAQFWQWSNWQALKAVHVRYGAALGNVLIEVVDDVERGKISAEIPWPGYITDLTLDAAGNVKAYALEYKVRNDTEEYMYRKEVDQTSFRYYKDDELTSVNENVYGFVPAVWIRHISNGTDFGDPAISGAMGKVDELNNLASHAHDQIHKVSGAPLVLWSDGVLSNLFGKKKDISEPADQQQQQDSLLMLRGPTGGSVSSLAGNLNLADVASYIDRLLSEIEQDFPELALYREMRNMSQITGPAAARLIGDVSSRVAEVSAGYDQQNIKLFQMAVAIGGYRAATTWTNLTPQQQKFASFNLDSYQAGQLDFAIMPRQLISATKTEQAQEMQAFWIAVKAARDAGVPLEIVLEDQGWPPEKIQELVKLKDEQDQKNLAMMQQKQSIALANGAKGEDPQKSIDK